MATESPGHKLAHRKQCDFLSSCVILEKHKEVESIQKADADRVASAGPGQGEQARVSAPQLVHHAVTAATSRAAYAPREHRRNLLFSGLIKPLHSLSLTTFRPIMSGTREEIFTLALGLTRSSLHLGRQVIDVDMTARANTRRVVRSRAERPSARLTAGPRVDVIAPAGLRGIICSPNHRPQAGGAQ